MIKPISSINEFQGLVEFDDDDTCSQQWEETGDIFTISYYGL